MTRKLAILVCLAATTAALSLPAGAGAAGGLVGKLSAGKCSAEKSDLGKKRFAKKYGRKSMPACVKKTRPEARRAVATATVDCQDELTDFGAEFYEDWISFAECVEYYAEGELNGWGDEEDDGDWDDEEEDPLL